MNHKPLNRRRFAEGMAKAMLAAGIAPQIVRAQTVGRGGGTAPSNRVAVAHIGTGGQGTSLMLTFLNCPSHQPVVLCDPFAQRREAAGQAVKEKRGQMPELANDFREVVRRADLDACVIATPDHWHVPVALAAVRAGKDIYVEKPLGLSLNENHRLREACQAGKRIFQYGTMQRAQGHMRKGIELVLNGAIGKLQRLDVWAPGGASGGSLDEIPVPAGLDYDLYLGPAPIKPCTKDRLTSNGSYFCSDYALGFIAGWGSHPLDIAIWGIDSDQAGPWKVKASGEFPGPGLFDACMEWDADIAFADSLTMKFQSATKAKDRVAAYRKDWQTDGTTFHGTDGWISLSRGGFDASNLDLMRGQGSKGPRAVRYEPDYHGAFLKSVVSRQPSPTPIEDAVRSDAVSHLALLAIKTGREVVWDPKAYRITAPDGMAARMDRAFRSPYGLG